MHSWDAASRGISSFQALVVSVAGRVGGGNIAGVAVAITLGGPGAVFWMWLIGLMGMATFTEDENQLSDEFTSLQQLYQELAPQYGFHTLSMGMSGDYPIALEHGSNMVRVGSSIFGARNYTTNN